MAGNRAIYHDGWLARVLHTAPWDARPRSSLQVGGWALYLKDGVPAFHYNFLNRQRFTVSADKPVPPGNASIPFDFAYDGGGPGQGGKGSLYVNDTLVAEGRNDRTQPLLFSADETADVGIDLGTPVVEEIGAGQQSRFTGGIPRVTVTIKPAG